MDNHYNQYTVEELACDEAFVDWVVNGKQSDQWQRWQDSNAMLQPIVAEAKQLVETLKEEDQPTLTSKTKTDLWNSINSQLTAPKNNIRKLFIAATAVAACLALLFVTLPYFNEKQPSNNLEFVDNNTTETSELVLPDRSYVYLDQHASVQYDKQSFNNERVLHLKGQAFFDVEKGTSFLVKTAKGEVKVLGTTFNVIEENNNLTVICYTGKVAVSYKGENVILIPNEQSDFNAPDNKIRMELTDEVPMWVGGLVKFENEPLQNVIDQIESIYKVEINIDNQVAKDRLYTGTIVKNDINKAMTSLTWPLHLRYTLEGNQIMIEKQD